MPPWNTFVQKYALDPEDMPYPHGPNVVVIEGFGSEDYFDSNKKAQVRHRLWLAGWQHPMRLHNARIKILSNMFGVNTEDAVGKKIALQVMADSNFGGEVKLVLMIHPMAVPQETPPAAVPARLAAKSDHRRQLAAQYGVTISAAPASLPAETWRGVGAAANGVAVVGGHGDGGVVGVVGVVQAAMGVETASRIVAALEQRGKTWDDLVAHARLGAMGEAFAGRAPADVSAAAVPMARSFVASFPRTKDVDLEARAKEIRAAWVPPPPPAPTRSHPAKSPSAKDPASGVVIDPNTGEVVGDLPDDDIPF